jgi:hypothetical protein
MVFRNRRKKTPTMLPLLIVMHHCRPCAKAARCAADGRAMKRRLRPETCAKATTNESEEGIAIIKIKLTCTEWLRTMRGESTNNVVRAGTPWCSK